MPLSGAERQARSREKADKARADIERRLAIAERPAMLSEAVLLLEAILDGVLEMAWRANLRLGPPEDRADRTAFRARLLATRDLPDVIAAFRPHIEPDMLADFDRAIASIRLVYETARTCTSFESE